MSTDGPREAGAQTSGSSGGGALDLLRGVALAATLAGAGGSVTLMLRAGQRTPRLLLAFFVLWVFSPFAALLWANTVSKRWSTVTRATLYCVTLVVAAGSVAIYGEVLPWKPPGSANAFRFVAVPPASWLFMTTIIALAAFLSGRRPRGGTGA